MRPIRQERNSQTEEEELLMRERALSVCETEKISVR